MMRASILVLALAVTASAQLQINFYDGKSEQALTAVTDLGTTSMGDSSEYRFHARNNTIASIALLPPIKIAGQSFTISDQPVPLPYIVAPGSFAEFRVRFSPADPGSYSASLTVNGASWLLRASAVAAPTVSVVNAGPALILTAGAPIDFGRVQKKQSVSKTIRLSNGSTAPLTIQSVGLSAGTVFHSANPPQGPLALAPGEARDFQISFDPLAAGQYNGILSIDNRSFPLTGIGYDPPMPAPSLTLTGPQTSGSQPTLSIRFASIPETSGNGIVTLDFRSSLTGVGDDPAVMFLPSASRSLSFTVVEGAAVASIGGLTEVPVQLGTTAGTVTLTLQLAGTTAQTSIEVPAAAITIDKASANRRVNDLDIVITAFDNTRTAGQFNFTFFDSAGKVVAPGAIHVNSTSDFNRYFAISRVGGVFLTRLTFPVTGDASQIAGVEVELLNKAGKSQTGRLNMQ